WSNNAGCSILSSWLKVMIICAPFRFLKHHGQQNISAACGRDLNVSGMADSCLQAGRFRLQSSESES
ncbi:MAG: hypothetical protein KGJ73_08345, partial [Rhodospirillales bacterium]|nr:hypothetical protein [Rhodospirillales bacterium]